MDDLNREIDRLTAELHHEQLALRDTLAELRAVARELEEERRISGNLRANLAIAQRRLEMALSSH